MELEKLAVVLSYEPVDADNFIIGAVEEIVLITTYVVSKGTDKNHTYATLVRPPTIIKNDETDERVYFKVV